MIVRAHDCANPWTRTTLACAVVTAAVIDSSGAGGSIGVIDSWLNGANTTGKPPRSSSWVNRPNSAGPVSGSTRSTPVSTAESRTSDPSTGRPELEIATPAAQANSKR